MTASEELLGWARRLSLGVEEVEAAGVVRKIFPTSAEDAAEARNGAIHRRLHPLHPVHFHRQRGQQIVNQSWAWCHYLKLVKQNSKTSKKFQGKQNYENIINCSLSSLLFSIHNTQKIQNSNFTKKIRETLFIFELHSTEVLSIWRLFSQNIQNYLGRGVLPETLRRGPYAVVERA